MLADLILPLALPRTYSYSVPKELELQITEGCMVAVQLKNNKLYSAVVHKLYPDKQLDFTVRPIVSVINSHELVNKKQLEFWFWLAEYYMCSVGEVMRAALPGGLKLESATEISLATTDESELCLSEAEAELYIAIRAEKKIHLHDLIKLFGKKDIIRLLQNLQQKNAIYIDENLQSTYKPKLETLVLLHENIDSEEKLSTAIDSLKRAPKQQKLLMHYLSLWEEMDFKNPLKISQRLLLKQSETALSIFKSCVAKQIFQTDEHEIGRFERNTEDTQALSSLSQAQQKAFEEINQQFEDKNTVLLHGVTSSGKTEIYLKLIEQQIKQGKQVLYLLPEIALTSQLLLRLQKVFGAQVGIYHSKYADAQRVEVYRDIAGDISCGQKYSIVIGTRSALFLPFRNLGLIIVDEEHEPFYKQQDPAPRYNGRDAAIKLAHIHGAKALLGTATPSIESYYNALNKKYGLVRLNERFGMVELPQFETSSILRNMAKKQMNGHFTKQLLEAIYVALKNKEQVILFQNRRGFSPYIQCEACGDIPQCQNCNVSLTYYKRSNDMRCHYCGYSIPFPVHCHSCDSENIKTKGFGTEKIEEELSVIFPKARAARFDLDTTRTRNAYQKIIGAFENYEIDILVGTQMLGKGLDFDNVSVVGVLNVDNILNFPDFRSQERAFQLMTQVGGRAGRRKKKGRVIVQTYNPENKIVRDVVDNNYEGFFARQIEERKSFLYPPFVRLIEISLRHRNLDVLNQASGELAKLLRQIFGANVLGPEAPAINRIQNRYINLILLKIPRNQSTIRAKEALKGCLSAIQNIHEFKGLSIKIDVDP